MPDELQRLFQELVDLGEEERERRMEELSLPENLRQELRELFQHDNGPPDRWQAAIEAVAASALEPDHWIGAMAGAYRLERLLGHGGMGAVYLGQRTDGEISHRAAIKLIHSSAPGIRDRFLRERQILASLSHPNIAPLLDAGAIAGGVPYFAMEYCEGEAIDKYCESRGLETAGILRLMLPVCSAVHYAHQRMIVHRDLKPSNIFVTSGGVPKLLDFGIAKILDDSDAEATVTGAQMMTLQFASPEQIRGELVSAASDVYSIGAVLYFLLTGHYVREASLGAISQSVLHAEPARPRQWRPDLPRDVENILLTALRSQPEARYSSAEALADDIRRFLVHRPVLATPPSVAYRLSRFAQRNPVAVAAALLAVVSLTAGTAVSVYQARQARKNLADVRQMANVMLFDFDRSIRDLPGTLEARHRVVTTARNYLERIAPQAGNDPELLREVADAYASLAEVEYSSYISRQGTTDSVKSLQESLRIRRRLNDASSTEPKRLFPYIQAVSRLCGRSTIAGRHDVARESCAEAVSLADAWLRREPGSTEALLAAQEAYMRNGGMRESTGEAGEARQSLERSLRYATELARQLPENPEYRLRLSQSARVYGELLLALKEAVAAVNAGETAVQASLPLLAISARNINWRLEVVLAHMAAGSAHLTVAEGERDSDQHLARAGDLLVKAMSLARETAQLDPMSSSAQDTLVVTMHRLSRIREQQRRYSDALDLYREARGIIHERLSHESTRRNLYLMGNNYLNAAEVHLHAGQRVEAASALEESGKYLLRTLAKEPNDAVAVENLITVYFDQAKMAVQDHDSARARERWQLAWQQAQTLLQRDSAAKAYLSDYPGLEALGRRLGQLPPAK